MNYFVPSGTSSADFQFRWLERRRQLGSKDRDGNLIDVTGYSATQTLQFRTRIMQMGRIPVGAGDGNTYVAHEKPMGWAWSEWTDVPTEVVHVE